MKKPVKIFLKVFLSIILVGVIVLTGFAIALFSGIIDTTDSLKLDEINLNLSSYVYYLDEKTGEYVEYERLYADENRIWADLEEIPDHVKNAAIAIEDERFYSHSGVDFKSTFKAIYTYVFKNSTSRGGSTITQQLVKNITGDSQKKVGRKIQEMVRAIQLENKLSKDEILELYLNSIYLSQGCNGLKTASEFYFDKDVSELSIAEGACLVGITQYPTLYDPLINPDENKKKQELVLSKMYDLDFITEEEYKDAVNEELVFVGKLNSSSKTRQSYFVDEIIREVINDLQDEYGYTESVATQMLYSGGLKIYSTVDPVVQKAVDEVFSNPNNLKSGYKGTPQASMCVMDPYTGQVKALVGGFGEKEGTLTLNRATGTLRQPGSTIKPIAVYAPAIDKGLITPGSIYTDKQIKFGSWAPKNYYSGFKGDVTVKYAVEQSINTVPVQILQELGVNKSYDFLANKLGVSTLCEGDKSLASLGLGGLTNGISNMELTAAYCAFVNDGVYNTPITYVKVLDGNNNVLLEKESKSNVAMKTSTARTINWLLKCVCDFGTGTPARFSSQYSIAGKTGTTDNDNDRWFVGYTPYYCAAVWVGYDTPSTLSFYGSNPTIPLWRSVMQKVHESKKLPSKSFAYIISPVTEPKNELTEEDLIGAVCDESGLLATLACPPNGVSYPDDISAITEHCNIHVPEPSDDENTSSEQDKSPVDTPPNIDNSNLSDSGL